MEENKNYNEPEENASQESEKVDNTEPEKAEQHEVEAVVPTESKPNEDKKPFDKKNLVVYAAIGIVLALVITVIVLLAGNGNTSPNETTPKETTIETTPNETTVTTPETTTPAGPTETVTYPSNEDNDPKQEDVFFD